MILDEVRRLIETSTLSYRAIARATGISRSTISRHVLAEGWLRPAVGDSPDLVAAAKRRLKRGELAERMLSTAEKLVIQVEMNPRASAADFARAARLLETAK